MILLVIERPIKSRISIAVLILILILISEKYCRRFPALLR